MQTTRPSLEHIPLMFDIWIFSLLDIMLTLSTGSLGAVSNYQATLVHNQEHLEVHASIKQTGGLLLFLIINHFGFICKDLL